MRLLLRCFALAVLVTLLHAPAARAADDDAAPGAWGPLRFLVGTWIGDMTGKPGEPVGGFSLLPALDGRILVRKNRADYPAAADKPAYAHKDLMVVYKVPGPDSLRATYWDNEGHQIAYGVRASAGGDTVVFQTVPASGQGFRLSYVKKSEESIDILFDIAPPAHPDAFARYLTASAHRRK